ncbi:hypothetical protein AB0I81_23090 [Nonomuraea sp. NPDC050404]|uniref:hypothetical protein n=1 Tax=Nonomuraea sp. NPDC050404 TaxID=3155783 RepID=UPI0033C2031C
MRSLREARAVVLADVARAARAVGLSWDASAVSRIETGARQLTLDEFLTLPRIMTAALCEPTTLVTLLADGTGSLSETWALLAEPGVAHLAVEAIPDLARKAVECSKRAAETQGGDTDLYDRAAELGVTPEALSDAMTELWDVRSLRAERERRLRESDTDLSQPTRARTARGHLTRQLMAELRHHLAENGQ